MTKKNREKKQKKMGTRKKERKHVEKLRYIEKRGMKRGMKSVTKSITIFSK